VILIISQKKKFCFALQTLVKTEYIVMPKAKFVIS